MAIRAPGGANKTRKKRIRNDQAFKFGYIS